MRVRVILVSALSAIGLLASFAPAQASQVCANATVVLNGETVVNESHCVDV